MDVQNTTFPCKLRSLRAFHGCLGATGPGLRGVRLHHVRAVLLAPGELAGGARHEPPRFGHLHHRLRALLVPESVIALAVTIRLGGTANIVAVKLWL